jgi:hypothetical protein
LSLLAQTSALNMKQPFIPKLGNVLVLAAKRDFTSRKPYGRNLAKADFRYFQLRPAEATDRRQTTGGCG